MLMIGYGKKRFTEQMRVTESQGRNDRIKSNDAKKHYTYSFLMGKTDDFKASFAFSL